MCFPISALIDPLIVYQEYLLHQFMKAIYLIINLLTVRILSKTKSTFPSVLLYKEVQIFYSKKAPQIKLESVN